jgi:uncharacterized SAM-binding protein YcdF (DUF218 family)
MRFSQNKYLLIVFIILLIIISSVLLFSNFILIGISRALTYEDSLVKAEAIVILAGGAGSRVETGAELFSKGFGKKIVFSGFKIYPETYTSDLMKAYALKLGVPEDKILAETTNHEVSTHGEALANIKLLKKNHIKKIILVTSAFHTRRTKLIYERAVILLDYNMEFFIFPASDPHVPIKGWWKLRSGRKGILLEYTKSLAYYLR